MELFLDPRVEFEKVAAEVRLPESPDQWATEILQELYKQVPYISDFDPKIIMDRVDAEQGFGFGHVEVKNKTEAPDSASAESMEAAGIQEVRIPIVIKSGKLSPLIPQFPVIGSQHLILANLQAQFLPHLPQFPADTVII